MFSLRVLAAIIVIVIIISLLLINFDSLADKTKSIFKNEDKSGSVGWVPGKSSGSLDLTVFPEGVFILKTDSPVTISLEANTFSNCLGEISVDYINKSIKFTDSRSPLKVDLQLAKVNLGVGLKLNKLTVSNAKMNITKDGWVKNIENGTIEVEGFVGGGAITPESFQLTGNISRFVEK